MSCDPGGDLDDIDGGVDRLGNDADVPTAGAIRLPPGLRDGVRVRKRLHHLPVCAAGDANTDSNTVFNSHLSGIRVAAVVLPTYQSRSV